MSVLTFLEGPETAETQRERWGGGGASLRWEKRQKFSDKSSKTTEVEPYAWGEEVHHSGYYPVYPLFFYRNAPCSLLLLQWNLLLSLTGRITSTTAMEKIYNYKWDIVICDVGRNARSLPIPFTNRVKSELRCRHAVKMGGSHGYQGTRLEEGSGKVFILLYLGLHFGSKKLGIILVVFEDLLENSVFFWTEVKR